MRLTKGLIKGESNMELSQYFKSVLEQDRAQIVICNLEHDIIYMNPSAVNHFEKRGGASLVGKSIFSCHNDKSCELIRQVVSWFSKSPDNNIVHTFFDEKKNKDIYIVALRDDEKKLIGYYEKHEYRNKETAKPYDI
jgi:PAS domain-containing protein